MATLPITREWLASTQFLGGVRLNYDDGRPFEQSLFDHAIEVALAEFETLTMITVMPTEIVDERHDFSYNSRTEFIPVRLRKRPVIAEEGVSLSFWLAEQKIIDIPSQWVQVQDYETALVRLLPISGTGPRTTFAGRFLAHAPWTWRGRIPDYLRYTYWAGFPVGDLGLLHDAVRDLTSVYERGEQGVSFDARGVPVGLGHRAATQGDPKIHGAADTTNTLAANGGASRYTERGSDAASLAALIVQLNAIRAAYEAHRVLVSGGVHGAADSINIVTAPAATDLDSAVALINDLQVVLADHLSLGSPVHGQADTVRRIRAGAVRADYVKIPSDIRMVLGALSGIHALNVAGDLVAGAGVASKSTSVDALSQSIGTTASAMYSGYSARIGVLKKSVSAALPAIRRRYMGVMFGAGG